VNDPELLTTNDVKEFLTYLAVKQKVSASSQNQAFNALLFFFRHVLNREFGKIDGVVRAKRRPYIPVVLSREEIDAIVANLKYPYDLVVKLLYGCGLRLFECLNLRIKGFNFDFQILTVHDERHRCQAYTVDKLRSEIILSIFFFSFLSSLICNATRRLA